MTARARSMASLGFMGKIYRLVYRNQCFKFVESQLGHYTFMKKLIIVSLVLVIALFGYLFLHSRADHAAGSSESITGIPQFLITASDVSTVSVQPVTSIKTGRKTAELDVVFSSSKTAEFHKFAQEHLKQKVQFLVGTNLLVETRMDPTIASGKLELSYSTLEEAQAVADSLTKR